MSLLLSAKPIRICKKVKEVQFVMIWVPIVRQQKSRSPICSIIIFQDGNITLKLCAYICKLTNRASLPKITSSSKSNLILKLASNSTVTYTDICGGAQTLCQERSISWAEVPFVLLQRRFEATPRLSPSGRCHLSSRHGFVFFHSEWLYMWWVN